MNGTCRFCIFTEVCDANYVAECEHFYPVDEHGYEDGQVIEEERQSFYKEWFSYIGEYNDDIFF